MSGAAILRTRGCKWIAVAGGKVTRILSNAQSIAKRREVRAMVDKIFFLKAEIVENIVSYFFNVDKSPVFLVGFGISRHAPGKSMQRIVNFLIWDV